MLYTFYRVAFSVLILFSVTQMVSAGPQIPQQGLDLDSLDRNNAPFRYFHLRNYPGSVLNARRITPPRKQEKPVDLSRIRNVLPKLPQLTGLRPPAYNAELVNQGLNSMILVFDEEMILQQRTQRW